MENASKALLIAGGVLLAVIILSVMIYSYVHMQSLERAKAEVLRAEELAAFNREFESYNKKNMYGTDIISVVNKANSYNKKYDMDLITIYIKINENMDTIVYQYEFKNGEWESRIISDDSVLEPKSYTNKTINSNNIFNQEEKWNERYELVFDESGRLKSYQTMTTAFSLLKRSSFLCESITYNQISGQIESMSFIQK